MRAPVDLLRTIAGLSILALLATPSCGLGAAAPSASLPPAAEDMDSFQLANGLRVFLAKPWHMALMSEALLVVKAGTVYEPREPANMAWLTAEALFSGTLDGSEESVRHFMARSGISMDLTVGQEVAVFRFSVPKFQTIPFVHFLATVLERPPDEEVWKEAVERRRTAMAGQEADLWHHSTEVLDSLTWKGVPAPADAQRRLLEVTGPAAASRSGFRAAAYVPERMVLSLWGDFPLEMLRVAIDQRFSRWSPGGAAAELVAGPRPEPEPAGRPLTRCFQVAGAQPAALFVGLSVEAEDDFTFYGWQVLAQILGASDVSRLHQRMRVEEGLTYTVEASFAMVAADSLTLRVVGQTDQVERSRQVILEEVARLLREEVSAEEIAAGRAILRSRLQLDHESLRDQFYRRSLDLLADEPVRDPAAAEKVLAELTPGRLLEMARATLHLDEAVTMVVSSRSEPLCAKPPTEPSAATTP